MIERATIDTGHPNNVLRVYEADAFDGLYLAVTGRNEHNLTCGECDKEHVLGLTRETIAELRDELTRYLESE